MFIYGLIAWNGYLSVSASRLLPNYEFIGFEQYTNLFESERWWVALRNLGIAPPFESRSACSIKRSPIARGTRSPHAPVRGDSHSGARSSC